MPAETTPTSKHFLPLGFSPRTCHCRCSRQKQRSAGCRIVYLCREPKDAFVSRWHFENKIVKGSNIDLGKALDMFCEGFSPSGPFWNHCLEYWKESLAREDEVLFLKYEEIKSQPEQVVRQLAKFLGVPLTAEEESAGVAQDVVKLCSFENLTSLQVNRTGGVDHGNKIYVERTLCSFGKVK